MEQSMLERLTDILGTDNLPLAVQCLEAIAKGPSDSTVAAIECRGVAYWGNCPTCGGSVGLWRAVFELELGK